MNKTYRISYKKNFLMYLQKPMWFYLLATKDNSMGKIWGKIFSDAKCPDPLLQRYRVPSLVCIEIMWLKLHRNDFLRVSDRLNRCIESTSALYGNDRKQLQLFYARRGKIAWPNISHYSLSSKLQSSLNMCRFQMRSCMENCAISRREIDEKYLIYSRNYSIPHRNEEKKWILRCWFFWLQF